MKTIYFAVNISDLSEISGINKMVFQMTIADKIEHSIVETQKNRIDGRSALIKTHLPQIQQVALASLLAQSKWNLRVYYSTNAKTWYKLTKQKAKEFMDECEEKEAFDERSFDMEREQMIESRMEARFEMY